MKLALLTVILAIILIAFAILLLGIKVLFIPGAKFPMGHHAHHKAGGCISRQITETTDNN